MTGLTGKGGWLAYWNHGAPRSFKIDTTQVPKGSSIIFATR